MQLARLKESSGFFLTTRFGLDGARPIATMITSKRGGKERNASIRHEASPINE